LEWIPLKFKGLLNNLEVWEAALNQQHLPNQKLVRSCKYKVRHTLQKLLLSLQL